MCLPFFHRNARDKMHGTNAQKRKLAHLPKNPNGQIKTNRGDSTMMPELDHECGTSVLDDNFLNEYYKYVMPFIMRTLKFKKQHLWRSYTESDALNREKAMD